MVLHLRSVFILFIIFSFSNLQAAEPTVIASDFKVSNTTCNGATLSWKNGNGERRIILFNWTSPVDASPIDDTVYKWGARVCYSSICTKNYIHFNGTDSTVTLNLFTPNLTVYIAIFEYNGVDKPDYLTSAYYVDSFKMLATPKLDFSFSHSADSCAKTNKIKLTNKSTTSLTNAVYRWEYYNSPPGFITDTSAEPVITFANGGVKRVDLVFVSADKCAIGGKTSISKQVLIYPRVNPGAKLLSDSVACLSQGHFFHWSSNSTLDFVPKSAYAIYWIVDDEIRGAFPEFYFSFNKPGKQKVLYVAVVLYDGKPKCYDSLYLHVNVLDDPKPNLGQDQFIDTNTIALFPGHFSKYKWNDNSTGDTLVVSGKGLQQYTNVFSVEVTDSNGCTGKDEVIIYRAGTNATIGIPNASWRVFPVPANGELNIEGPTGISYEYSLFNFNGQRIVNSTALSQTKLDVSPLENGMYVLIISGDGKTLRYAIPLIR